MDNIDPGSSIHLTIAKQPTSTAAVKTLVRLLSKDPTIRKDTQRLRRIRQLKTPIKQRGGRQWTVRMVKQHRIKGRTGESGTITATLDVLADLKRVRQFLDIRKA